MKLYSYYMNISDNKFTAASGFAAETMLYIDNNHNITMVGNTFKDITAKTYGSRSKINCVKATLNGLMQLRSKEEIAALRGKSVEEIL